MSGENELIPQNDPVGHASVPAEVPEQRLLFTPPIDIYESEEGLVLVADLPGVTLENLELQVQDNKLTLFGRVSSYVPENMLGKHEEYGVGDFLRSFILPDVVDHERISAKLNNGVLKVVLPKAEQPEPRKISIDEGE
jgi:HSP20 family protein